MATPKKPKAPAPAAPAKPAKAATAAKSAKTAKPATTAAAPAKATGADKPAPKKRAARAKAQAPVVDSGLRPADQGARGFSDCTFRKV